MDAEAGQINETLRCNFESAWINGDSPAIMTYLPPRDSSDYLPTLEELVMIDMEFRWKSRFQFATRQRAVQTTHVKAINDYLVEFPELATSHALGRLINEEIYHRQQSDELPVDIESYRQRFPQVAAELTTFAPSGDSKHNALQPGTRLGRYQLIEMYARGGFGEVWRAFDTVLHRVVALKTIQQRFLSDPSVRQRFSDEARTTAGLEHPGIVSVHDLDDKDATPYYAMRFLGGKTLAEVIQEYHTDSNHETSHSVQRTRLLASYLAICRAVEFAHSKRVIHRDLKPQNIVLGDFGEISILDWGLAKDVSEPAPTDTSTADKHPARMESPIPQSGTKTMDGAVLGTPAYMSPEQARGDTQAVGERSDQFCLGAVLFEIITGEAPHRQKQSAEDVDERLLLLDHGKESAALAAICKKAMCADPRERYESVAALIEDIERFLADQPIAAYDEPWSTKTLRWIKRHKTGVAATATGLLIALLISTAALILLLDVNRDLDRQRNQTKLALDEATEHLYSHSIGLAHAELRKNNVVRASELLQACPEELRDWEWRFLQGLINRHTPSKVLQLHESRIRAISFSADSARLASADHDGQIRVVDTTSWNLLAKFHFGGSIRDAAFLPDGRLCVVGEIKDAKPKSGQLLVYDVSKENVSPVKRACDKTVRSIAYLSSASQLATSSDDGEVTFWDTERFEPALTLPIGKSRHIAVSDSGESPILAACRVVGPIDLWDISNQERLTRLQGHEGRSTRCLFSPSGTELLSVGHDKLMKRWAVEKALNASKLHAGAIDEQDGEDIQPYPVAAPFIGHTDKLECLAAAPDGKTIATAGYDRSIRFWDSDGSPLATVRHHTSHVRDLAFSPDGNWFASAGDELEIYVWPTARVGHRLPEGKFVEFSTRSDQLTVATDYRVQLYDPVHNKLLHSVDLSDRGRIIAMRQSADGELVACALTGGDVVVVETISAEIVHQLSSDEVPVYDMIFTPNAASIVGACRDGKIRVWHRTSGALERTFDSEDVAIQLMMDATGEQLIVGYANGDIAWWNLEQAQLTQRVKAHHPYLVRLGTHAGESRLASTGGDGLIKIWDLQTGELLQTMQVGESWLNCVGFTVDGKRLVSGSEHTITFWDPITGQEITSMALDGCVHNLSFNSTGELLALAGEAPRIRIWSAALVDSEGDDENEAAP